MNLQKAIEVAMITGVLNLTEVLGKEKTEIEKEIIWKNDTPVKTEYIKDVWELIETLENRGVYVEKE